MVRRVLGHVGELLLLAVEEAVRRAGVDDELVLDPCLLERPLERLHVLRRDPRVVAAHQPEDRRADVGGAIGRPRCPSCAVPGRP